MQSMASIWQQQTQPPAAAPLHGDIRADVLVIGSGLCGLLTAYRLREKGIGNIAVIDAGPICGGTSARTTAKITSQHGMPYAKLLQDQGQERAAQYAAANQKAVEQYAALAAEIDCDFRRCDAVAYAIDPAHLQEVEQEVDAAARLELPATYATKTELPFSVAGGVRFAGQACMQPLKFAYGLAAELIADGVALYPNTKAMPHETGQPSGKIQTDHGSVAADTVVLATHFPFMDKAGLYFARLWQERSYILALEQVPAMQHLYWGLEEGAFSFRAYTTAEGEKGLLIGGGSHKAGHECRDRHHLDLRKTAKEWYPEGRAVASWSAQDCMTHDGIPFIGRYKQLDDLLAPRVYLATGFGKWGMTASMVAADIISDDLTGKFNSYAEVFSPSRFDPTAKAKKFVVENTDMLKNYIGGFIRVPKETADSLHKGEGAVVTMRGEKVGVYKGKDGQLHTVHPFCTHMGCALLFNQEEETWDCPCHGSRYDIDGHVLNNPADKHLST